MTNNSLEKTEEKPSVYLPKIYLLPNLLGQVAFNEVLPSNVLVIVESLNVFVVENEKSARKFIKTILPEKDQTTLIFFVLNKHEKTHEYSAIHKYIKQGQSVGVLSDAGMPSIADPGSKIIQFAHQNNIPVVPLVGPSSIFLALVASGLNGQQFAFHGYLPIDKSERKKSISLLEKQSLSNNQAQIFMETPYRNDPMLEDILKYCHPNTQLCLACDITLETEFIQTKSIFDWRKNIPNLDKRPCIFIIQS